MEKNVDSSPRGLSPDRIQPGSGSPERGTAGQELSGQELSGQELSGPGSPEPKTESSASGMPNPGYPEETTRIMRLGRRLRPAQTGIEASLALCAALSIITTVGIIATLGTEAFGFFREVSIIEFFTGRVWQPAIEKFGILPLLTATLTTSFWAMLVALPLGLVVAIYLAEYASVRVRDTLKPILEVLAGIPTVVYGYFALTTVTPLIRGIFGQGNVEVYNTLSAGLVMGVLILPLIASMCEDALSAVPMSLREASFAMGATKLETSIKVVVPAAFSGLAAAFILALSRAVGETMIVSLAAGAGPNLTLNPFRSAETMTGHIVRISGGDLSYDSIDYRSLFAIALFLFIVTLALNLISRKIIRRYREVYE